MLALSLESAFREKANNNIKYGLNKPLANLPNLIIEPDKLKSEPINTRAEVAKIADVSERTIGYAKVIIEKGTPEQIAKLETREASIGKIYTEIKEKKKSEKAQAEETEPQKELPVVAETP